MLVVLLVLAAIGTGVYSLTRSHKGGGAAGKSGGTSASPSVAANTVLTPVGAGGYDALGIANDPGNEDNGGAGAGHRRQPVHRLAHPVLRSATPCSAA